MAAAAEAGTAAEAQDAACFGEFDLSGGGIRV